MDTAGPHSRETACYNLVYRTLSVVLRTYALAEARQKEGNLA